MHWLTERLADFGDRIALVCPGGSATCSGLAGLIARCLEEARQQGFSAGSVVAVSGDYSPASIAWIIALAELRCIVVPLAGRPAEHPVRLQQAGTEFLVRAAHDQWVVEKLTPVGERHALLTRLMERERAGLVLFSSGSTGVPKAMVHDFTALLDTYRDRRAKSLSLIVLLLFDHIGGLNTLFNALAMGAKLVVPGDRSPGTVAGLIAQQRVTVLPASPTFLNLLLVSGEHMRKDLSSLRLITYGTEPMPESQLARLHKAFPKARLVQTFGTSETGIAQTSSPSSGTLWLRIEDPNLEWKIVEGELWLRSRTQILGYLNHSMDHFTQDGWFRTGDRAELGPNETLRVLGRQGELINIGGDKVMPAEVESVIFTIPGVADCLVRGEPSRITGQTVVAQVVALPGNDLDALKSEIRRACRLRLSPHKTPTKVTFVDSLGGERLKKLRRTEGMSA